MYQQVTDGQFNITVSENHVYTLSTTTGQMHGDYPDVPASRMFPIPYSDDFESTCIHLVILTRTYSVSFISPVVTCTR